MKRERENKIEIKRENEKEIDSKKSGKANRTND